MDGGPMTARLHLVTEAGRASIPADWTVKYAGLTLGEAATRWLDQRRREWDGEIERRREAQP